MQRGDRRWTGATLAWLIPLLALGNGATSYFGLKTVANYSMFSNLCTEGGQTNHFLIPAGQFFVADYQRSGAPRLRRPRAAGGMALMGAVGRRQPPG